MAWYIDPRVGGNLTINLGQSSIPPILGILIGETVYNLRAALDYLLYELAILDSGQIQEGTQFPIENTPEGWQVCMEGRKRGKGYYLRGLSPTHKAAIKFFQPCFGCNWTGTLQSISNLDKHRTLTIVRATQTFSVESASNDPVILNPSTEGKTSLFHVRVYPPPPTIPWT